MRFDIITLFPEICEAAFSASIMGRARREGKFELAVHQLRDWGLGRHKQVDDYPFGFSRGGGMLLKPEPIFAAVAAVRRQDLPSRVIVLGAGGEIFSQKKAVALAGFGEGLGQLIFICGHYEGIDHRVVEHLADEEISLGKFIISNGAIAANVVVDAIARQIHGVLGNDFGKNDESFADENNAQIEAPQYTRPADFDGMQVPEILRSGNHAAIEQWRSAQQ